MFHINYLESNYVECIPDIDNFDLVVDAQVSVTPHISNLERRPCNVCNVLISVQF